MKSSADQFLHVAGSWLWSIDSASLLSLRYFPPQLVVSVQDGLTQIFLYKKIKIFLNYLLGIAAELPEDCLASARVRGSLELTRNEN